jgi:hypothetical protein
LSEDIFQFWSRMPSGAFQHPDDKHVLRRIDHHFERKCIANVYAGKLKTAPVVLLFLSPGLDKTDIAHSASKAGRQHYEDQRTGEAPLPTEQHPSAHQWLRRILRQFDFESDEEYESARTSVATLNIGAYKSESFHDWPLLAALPSSRVGLEWAQSVLFPQAEKRERIVVCLRSPKHWGLGSKSKGYLFCPKLTRGGIMQYTDERKYIKKIVRKAVLGH